MIGTAGVIRAEVRKVVKGACILDDGHNVFRVLLSPHRSCGDAALRPIEGDEVIVSWRIDTDESLQPQWELTTWEIVNDME